MSRFIANEEAFFAVMTSRDLLKYIVYFQRGRRCTDVYYASSLCKYGCFHMLKEVKDLIFDQNTFPIAIQKGRMDMVQWLHEKMSENYTMEGLYYAFKFNQFKIAQWLYPRTSRIELTILLKYAAKNGSLEMIEWLLSVYNKPIFNTVHSIDHSCYRVAARYGHIPILEWLKNQNKSIPFTLLEDVCHCGTLPIVQWVLRNTNLKLNKKCVKIVIVGEGTLETFKFVCLHIHHTYENFMDALTFNRVDIVDFLAESYSKNIVDVTDLVSFGNVEVLQSLVKNNYSILFFGISLDYCDEDRFLTVLKFLYENNFPIDVKVCTRLASSKNYNSIIKWLCSLCDPETILGYLTSINSIEILKYFVKKGLLVQCPISPLKSNVKLSDLQWYYSNGYDTMGNIKHHLYRWCCENRFDLVQWVHSMEKINFNNLLRQAQCYCNDAIVEWVYSCKKSIDFTDIVHSVKIGHTFSTVFLLRKYYNSNVPLHVYTQLKTHIHYKRNSKTLQWLNEQIVRLKN